MPRGRPKGSKNKTKQSKPVLQLELSDLSFQNNPRLKKMGVKFALDTEQLEEYMKCAVDPIYFIEKYVKFMTDDGLRTVELYSFQKDLIQTFNDNRKVIAKTGRQFGKTTTTIGYMLHYVLFNTEKTVGVLAQKEKVATEILSKIKQSYEYIPMWMQQGISAWNATSIALENGCRILSESTSTGAIRGFTIHLLYLDEFAHVPVHIAEDFITSVYPTISSSKISKIIITSTPNGFNLFYKYWMDANKKVTDFNNWNNFVPIEVNWHQVPGRDEEWLREQKKVLGERKFNQDVLAEFLGSSNTLITSKKLNELVFIQPAESLFDNAMAVFERPQPNHSYCISADPSEGKGLDFSAFTVFDITMAPYKVVAKYRNNTVEDIMFASYIQQTGKHYNEAYVVVESNEIGSLVLYHLLNELEYDNIFYSFTNEHQELTATQATKAKVPGVKTSKKVKAQGTLTLKTIIENDQIILNDFDLVSELSTFVLKKNKTWGAEEGYHDDCVSTLWLFAWLTNQPFFRDISDLNMRSRLFAERERQIAENMPAAPVIISENYRKVPLDKDKDGQIWIPAEMAWDDALKILNGVE